jgi:hypothetical protein
MGLLTYYANQLNSFVGDNDTNNGMQSMLEPIGVAIAVVSFGICIAAAYYH